METVSKIIMMPVEEVKPYEKNPRKNSKTVELLTKIIPQVGFNVPLVLDKDNVIVKGHARYQAALALGMQTVPCVISEADPEAIKADRIADNKVFEFSNWVNEELLHEVDMLDLDFDFDAFGLPKLPIGGFEFDMMNDAEEFDIDNEDAESDEERRQRFLQLMAEEEAKATEVQIVTPMEIEDAKAKLREEPTRNQANYLSVTCEKCGHIFFVREGDAMSWE